MDRAVDIIGSLYEAAGDSTRWPDCLKKLGEQFHATGVLMIASEPRTFQVFNVVNYNVDQQVLREYVEYYSRIDPRRHLMPAHLGGIAFNHDLVPDLDAYKRSEFYNGLLAPNDLNTHMISLSSDRKDWVVGITIMRPEHRDYTAEEVALFQHLLPHINRACQLHMRICGMEGRIAADASALDQLNGGVILANGRGAVVTMNRHAEAILRAGDGLWAARDTLAAMTPALTGSLHAAIAAADLTARKKGNSAGEILRLPRNDGSFLTVLVSPLRFWNGQPNAPTVALFLKTAETSLPTPEGALSALYQLTAAEARVAASIIEGLTLKEIALRLGVTENTVRSQVKAIFAKTGTSRQGEFITRTLQEIGWIDLRR